MLQKILIFLATGLIVQRNYFSDLYPTKIFNLSAKSFFIFLKL